MTQRLLFALSIAFSLSGCTAVVDNNLKNAECLTNDDCQQTNACEGTRVCDGMTHTCVVEQGTAPSCDDGEACTADSCDAASGNCVNVPIDADHDGYSPGTCTTAAYAAKGGDCDDSNSAVNPGVMEICGNGIDDNCNGIVDTDAPANITCYQDADGDGFANPDVSMAVGCSCPAGYIQPNALGPDCGDGVADVHPGQTAWYGQFYCKQGNKAQPASPLSGGGYACLSGWTPSYDYNCLNGDELQNTITPNTTCSFGGLAAKAGSIITSLVSITYFYCDNTWDSASNSAPPACGQYGYEWTCTNNTCNSSTSWVQQLCH